MLGILLLVQVFRLLHSVTIIANNMTESHWNAWPGTVIVSILYFRMRSQPSDSSSLNTFDRLSKTYVFTHSLVT